ncbi:MAG: hypothetical protein A2Y62_08005 [Candidatus Fischerbacteria bacterium RBG_13_37_8]|uniref:Uncharacterized protein n=1 Tax=Candidatus Fischerbacteria bacterium RBG_13_37_8 TaxID=1817863 RepID=A0A1F5V598_9BACT|nr:MAG: hypothetical protein A2Y62_08005 [Candidatus Fischerbacteria bacterium RBG_13_37_8]
MKKFNKILFEINRIYVKLIDTENLKNWKIEKWRWDIPYISFVWTSNDDFINRNINSIIILESNPEINNENKFQIEINAWKDQDEQNAINLKVRKWYHKKIIELPHYKSSDAKNYIYKAYKELSALSESHLTNKNNLVQPPIDEILNYQNRILKNQGKSRYPGQNLKTLTKKVNEDGDH